MSKTCFFNSKKLCDDCGECEICDLDRSKTCNNCGKCLQADGMDLKSIQIDEIEEESVSLSDNEDFPAIESEDLEFMEEELLTEKYTFLENNEEWELINDIDGLEEILEDEKLFKSVAQEIYPGLISIKK